ncbi:hypothetical protein BT96DRAFT_981586 [Gymnopus androsaceus JB14]|uniref:Transmembrane protein n=1 Tax=Gymnopus androsaceus JB14 TaxID=1447944 RepID=A0A6A4GN25_9AGAR|nr:hypothetical protein BT96DRAFT_981586 [Gymnopus androsaceus JB14]
MAAVVYPTPDTAFPRLIVVDDTDPSIQYSPPEAFSLDTSGKLDRAGWGGPVFNGTITEATSDASFSYAFNGTFVRVMLATQQLDTNSSGWGCMVDGLPIHSFGMDPFQITNHFACDSGSILINSPGEHTLTVNLFPSRESNGSPIWLDSIHYQPLPSDPLDAVTLRVQNIPANGHGTTLLQMMRNERRMLHLWIKQGTSFIFNGTSAILYGMNFGGSYNRLSGIYNANEAVYAVDGGPSQTFALPGSASITNSSGTYVVSLVNWPLLAVDNLTEAQHEISIVTAFNSTVTNLANDATGGVQPLSVSYFYVKTNPAQLDNSSPNKTSSTPSSSSSSLSSLSSHGKTSECGAIVGGVVGGIACLVLLLLGFVFIR